MEHQSPEVKKVLEEMREQLAEELAGYGDPCRDLFSGR
jgi:hypothetical protein